MKRWVQHLTPILMLLLLAACSQNGVVPSEVGQVAMPTETATQPTPLTPAATSPTQVAAVVATYTSVPTASPHPATATFATPTATNTATPDPPFVHQLDPERPYSQNDLALLESENKLKFLNSYADW